MTFIAWPDQYALRVPALDDDHKLILDWVNWLRAALDRTDPTDQIVHGLHGLNDDIQEHFEREEELMKRHGYPFLDAHREQHRLLNRDLHAVRKLFTADADSIDMERVLAFLKAWWQNHILRSDKIFVSYLQGAPPFEADAPAGPGTPAADAADGTLVVPWAAEDPRGNAALKTVTVQVPAEAVDTLHCCARLLRRGGTDAANVRAVAHPLETMSLDEATIVARGLMR